MNERKLSNNLCSPSKISTNFSLPILITLLRVGLLTRETYELESKTIYHNLKMDVMTLF